MGYEGTAVHATSRVGSGVRLGRNVEIGPFSYLDRAITIEEGARLCGGVVFDGPLTIGAHCHIEPGVALTAARGVPAGAAPMVIEEGVYIGAGSVLSGGVRIGMGARIAAGTVVTREVPPYALVSGNPAVIGGYVRSEAQGPIPAWGASPERAVGAIVAPWRASPFIICAVTRICATPCASARPSLPPEALFPGFRRAVVRDSRRTVASRLRAISHLCQRLSGRRRGRWRTQRGNQTVPSDPRTLHPALRVGYSV